jgi:hypothetical protein
MSIKGVVDGYGLVVSNTYNQVSRAMDFVWQMDSLTALHQRRRKRRYNAKGEICARRAIGSQCWKKNTIQDCSSLNPPSYDAIINGFDYDTKNNRINKRSL